MATDDRFSIQDKTVLVVGGTSGIGGQIARGLAEVGATVVPVSRTQSKVDATVEAILSSGGKARGYTADVSHNKNIVDLVERVENEVGPIDVLLNSQGIIKLSAVEEFEEQDFDDIVDTNLKSVFFTSTEVGKRMLKRGSGAIINIASASSYRGWARAAIYSMTKWGVVSLTETMASEWGSRGVRVNAIAPGFFMTDLNRTKMAPERKANVLRRTPMDRFGELDELVGAAIYLASPASGFVNGETIRVDGGYLASGI
jgi:NAD(P)-dependent dehydrogenase (short-subunit alcohol dehydrogenase family)